MPSLKCVYTGVFIVLLKGQQNDYKLRIWTLQGKLANPVFQSQEPEQKQILRQTVSKPAIFSRSTPWTHMQLLLLHSPVDDKTMDGQ